MKKAGLLLLMGLILFVACKSKTKVIQKVINDEDVNYIPYYLEIQKTDSLYLTNNFEASYKILDSLFKIYEPINTDTYVEYGIYVNSAVMSNHLDDIEKKVREGYLKYGAITPRHKNWIDIDNKVFLAAKLTKEELEGLVIQYKSKLNLNLRNVLSNMFIKDQYIRKINSTDDEKLKVDEVNRKKIDSIFKEIGYPSNKIIGTNNAFFDYDDYVRVQIFFLHQPDEFKKKYLQIILDNVKKGNCEPDVYAVVFDRKMWENLDKQYFGSYQSETGEIKPPLLNSAKVDSLRKSIGLPNLKYNEWRLNKLVN